MTARDGVGAMSVLALVRDLLFSTRIGQTAERLGYPFRAVRTVEDLRAALVDRPGLVMLDLSDRGLDGEAALTAVEEAGMGVPVLAFTTHVLWKVTKPLHARCTRVVTKETLTAELPDLLQGYLAAEGRDRR